MKKERLDNLSDGIFAIIMTVLVFKLQISDVPPPTSSHELLMALGRLYPEFIAYMASFALLFTYWRGHNYTISVYAKNIDPLLSLLNAIFFLFVGFLPFSAHLVGRYHETPLAVVIYGVNTILITVTLHVMRQYVFRSKTIENPEYTNEELRRGTIRNLLPGVCALVAILFSFVNSTFSLLLFTFAILFNLVPGSTKLIDRLLYPRASQKAFPSNGDKEEES